MGTEGAEETNLPKPAAPARRELYGAGYIRLEDLTKVTETEIVVRGEWRRLVLTNPELDIAAGEADRRAYLDSRRPS
jgi:hypothetical protein